MAKYDSVLVDLRELFEEENVSKNYFSHMVLAMEVNENGTPIGAAVKMKCSPILALGIIDLLHDKLNEARNQVLNELKQYEEANMSVESGKSNGFIEDFDDAIRKALLSISDDDKAFFADCQKRAMDAIISNNEDELKSIVEEMRAYVAKKTKNDDSDDSSDGDFDINNFKGGF